MAWFCLGIPLLGIWVGRCWGSFTAGCISSAFYALSLSSVIRSTGLEISRENFSLPVLIASLLFETWADRSFGKRVYLFSLISSLLLGIALMTWDMIQFYIILWMLIAYIRLVRFHYVKSLCLRVRWICMWVILMCCGLLNPYLKADLFILSPAGCVEAFL